MKQEDIDDIQDPDHATPDEPAAPFSEQLGFGVGAFLVAGGIDLFAHFGLTGLVVGGVAAYVASQHGPELVEQVRGARAVRPSPTNRASGRVRRTLSAENGGKSQRRLLDRALGRFPDPPSARESDEDTVIVGEGDLPAHETWEGFRPAVSRHRAPAPLDLAPDLQIPLRELAGRAIFICGIRRHGKTTLGALLAEQLGRHLLPLFIPDLEGDYLSLAEVLPRAVLAGHSRAASQYPASQFVAVDNAQAAYRLGHDLLEYGYQVVLDLSSYNTLDEGVAIQINVIRGLFNWTNNHPDRRVPCHVYLDEAQRYLPQNLSDSVILNRTVLGMLLKCYMEIIGIGGKRGLAPVVLTQRFAQVNNKIMAQSEVFFLLRQTHDTDLDRCMEYVHKRVASKEQIARFRPGQGVYIACDGGQVVTHFHQRRSSGERSASPEPESASRYSRTPLFQLRARDSAAQETLQSAEQPGPRTTMPPVEPNGPEPDDRRQTVSITVLPTQVERRPQPSLQDAIGCWNELIEAGENPSRNNLQQALLAKGFECRENWARKFYEDIKAMLKEQPQASAGG